MDSGFKFRMVSVLDMRRVDAADPSIPFIIILLYPRPSPRSPLNSHGYSCFLRRTALRRISNRYTTGPKTTILLVRERPTSEVVMLLSSQPSIKRTMAEKIELSQGRLQPPRRSCASYRHPRLPGLFPNLVRCGSAGLHETVGVFPDMLDDHPALRKPHPVRDFDPIAI